MVSLGEQFLLVPFVFWPLLDLFINLIGSILFVKLVGTIDPNLLRRRLKATMSSEHNQSWTRQIWTNFGPQDPANELGDLEGSQKRCNLRSTMIWPSYLPTGCAAGRGRKQSKSGGRSIGSRAQSAPDQIWMLAKRGTVQGFRTKYWTSSDPVGPQACYVAASTPVRPWPAKHRPLRNLH